MFTYFPNNYMWSAGVNRIIYSGGTIGEVDRACRDLREAAVRRDNEAWHRAWLELAEQVERRAAWELTEGHTRSARETLRRACVYYQWAGCLLPADDARRRQTHARSVAVFGRACPLYEPPIEQVDVPYQGGSFPAYYLPPRNAGPGPAPALVMIPGLDSSKEQTLALPLQLAERGFASLTVDSPGIGESVFSRGLPARYDYEVPISAALEVLLARAEVDSTRVAVCGTSLGGYYAPRAAAFEPRFAACVAWGAQWDYQEVWEGRRVVRIDSPVPSNQDQLMLVTGQPNFESGLRALERWKLDGVAQRIRCPFLVTHGANDRQVPLEHAYKLYQAVGSEQKELKVFTEAEGGAGHCQNDNRLIGISYILDWL
jgi:fermentation-respiration switch protein FrsA (DUF1100 family)